MRCFFIDKGLPLLSQDDINDLALRSRRKNLADAATGKQHLKEAFMNRLKRFGASFVRNISRISVLVNRSG